MEPTQSMIIIYGPTGVGKTDLSLALARHLPIEIINMDVGQFYVPLSIGTAKPDWLNEPIKHHLFDILDSPRNITVIEYRELVIQTAQEIWGRKKIPVLVGGSGFYLKSLFFPPPHGTTQSFDVLTQYPPDADLWQELYCIDPVRAAAINKRDTYRIRRALEIWHTTGQKPSSRQAAYEPLGNYYLFFITRDRNDLYERINQRVITMLEHGWLNEIDSLVGTPWESFLNTKGLIGYRELLAYLSQERTPERLSHAIALIQQQTRHYAKRQITFFHMLERLLVQQLRYDTSLSAQGHIETVNLTHTAYDRYINHLLKWFKKE